MASLKLPDISKERTTGIDDDVTKKCEGTREYAVPPAFGIYGKYGTAVSYTVQQLP